MAFVIPFEDEPSEESIIKKHPPKRLQRLEENAGPLPTLEEITEKQAVVEMRRQQVFEYLLAFDYWDISKMNVFFINWIISVIITILKT